MKIAMIGQKGMPAIYGGVEKHVQDLSMRLVLSGHKVVVYSRKWYTKKEDGEINGVTIKHLPSIHTKHLDTITHSLFATIHAIISGCDVIHYHGVGPSLVAWMPRIFAPKIKVIVTFHSVDRYNEKWGLFAKLFLRFGEKAACLFPHNTITISNGLQNYCLNEFKKETVYLPNGVETKEDVTCKPELIKQFSLINGQYIVMVSRLFPQKGAHILLEAFRALKVENIENTVIQNLKLVIVGGSVYTKEYFESLQDAAAGCPDIVFTGFQSGETLKQLYINATALVHPSFSEGLPMTVLEAMSFGKPVLLSDISAHRELVKNSDVFFNENDVNDLKNRLVEFLNSDEQTKNNLGKENHKIVVKKYDWDKIATETERVYQNAPPCAIISARPSKSTSATKTSIPDFDTVV